MREIHLTVKVGGIFLAALLILAAQAAAQTPNAVFSSIYAFEGPPTDGFNARGGVAIASSGVLYGATVGGGSANLGTVFSLTPPLAPGDPWVESVLFSFPALKNGAGPQGGVAIGPNGVLYGTTLKGGASGLGTMFALQPPSAPGGTWTEKVLYSFKGGNDGQYPDAAPVLGSHGVLYGTTGAGGPAGAGTVYSLTPPTSKGNPWTEAVLYAFTGGVDGGDPMAPVVVGSGGVLYGTTVAGGVLTCSTAPPGCGTVFELTPPVAAGGVWTQTVLYAFTGGTDGVWAYGPVSVGVGGVLYGTTYENGTTSLGTVFSLTPPTSPGLPWTETVIYTFETVSQGNLPTGALAIGAGGILYGTTLSAGGPNRGNVFSLTPPTSSGLPWTEAVLYGFKGGSDGANPYAGVVMGPSGVLYGTTEGGGIQTTACKKTLGCGTVFAVAP